VVSRQNKLLWKNTHIKFHSKICFYHNEQYMSMEKMPISKFHSFSTIREQKT